MDMMELFRGPLGVIVAVGVGAWGIVHVLRGLIPGKVRAAIAMLICIAGAVILEGAGLVDVCGASDCGQWRWPWAGLLGAISASVSYTLHDKIQPNVRLPRRGGKQ